MRKDDLDVVGTWTQVKLAILREYAAAYTAILSKQPSIKSYAYIDAFAGAGRHIAKETGDEIAGSPEIALSIRPRFTHYHFIDLDKKRFRSLQQKYVSRADVSVHQGDCNTVLLERVFPHYRYEDYRRALCLLDPYGLNPRWDVVSEAGRTRSIEIFLSFMVMDANMNVLWRTPERVDPEQKRRMNAFWGDQSWERDCYREVDGLFETMKEKECNEVVVEAYRKRLEEVAGFKYVPEPMPMRNSKGAVIYYLFFASPNATGKKIVEDIFRKYRELGI